MKETIRQCDTDDVELLKAVSYQTFDETFRTQNKAENIEAYLKDAFTNEQLIKELKHPHSSFYFIYFNDNLAGYLKINTRDAQTESIGTNFMEIERIYILNHYQGHGLGNELLDFALETAKEEDKDKIWLGVWENNENAIGFYEKRGFTPVDTHTFYLGDEQQVDIIMIKALS